MAGDASKNRANQGRESRVRTSRPSLGKGQAEKAAKAVEKRKSRNSSALDAARKALGVKR